MGRNDKKTHTHKLRQGYFFPNDLICFLLSIKLFSAILEDDSGCKVSEDFHRIVGGLQTAGYQNVLGDSVRTVSRNSPRRRPFKIPEKCIFSKICSIAKFDGYPGTLDECSLRFLIV